MGDLLSLASAKEHLGISATTFDAVLATLITRATGKIERYCGRTFDSTAYTEDYDGDGSDVLIVRQYPIVSVTSVHDDLNRDFTDATKLNATDYYVDKDKGMVKLIGGRFGRGRGNIRVVYTGGYASVPDAIKLACADTVAFYFNRRRSAGRASESLGGLSVAHLPDLPADVREILENYRSLVATG